MFIVSDSKGNVYKEGEPIVNEKDERDFTWDDIPHNIRITQIQLTYPFIVKLKGGIGKAPRQFAPLLSFGKYDKYYFSNEATVNMLVQGGQSVQAGASELKAKIIGGIDIKKDEVLEVRLDKSGNCSINRFPYSALLKRIKEGTFREDIIRNGT
jgi:hypothetical protein